MGDGCDHDKVAPQGRRVVSSAQQLLDGFRGEGRDGRQEFQDANKLMWTAARHEVDRLIAAGQRTIGGEADGASLLGGKQAPGFRRR